LPADEGSKEPSETSFPVHLYRKKARIRRRKAMASAAWIFLLFRLADFFPRFGFDRLAFNEGRGLRRIGDTRGVVPVIPGDKLYFV
jgi:hypothetical protein